MVALAWVALVLGEALGFAATFEAGFLEIGFLTDVVLERGFCELVAGLAGELDATDMAKIMWQIEYDSNVFILAGYQWLC